MADQYGPLVVTDPAATVSVTTLPKEGYSDIP